MTKLVVRPNITNITTNQIRIFLNINDLVINF